MASEFAGAPNPGTALAATKLFQRAQSRHGPVDRSYPHQAAVAGAGGLGVAALAAFFLQSFHPFDVTFMDLSVHMVAVCIVVAVSTLAGDFSARRKVFHLGIVSLSNTQLFPSKERIRLGVSPLN